MSEVQLEAMKLWLEVVLQVKERITLHLVVLEILFITNLQQMQHLHAHQMKD